MARFVLGNRFEKAARQSGRLSRLLWRLEAGVFRFFLACARLFPAETATAIGRRVAGRVGPRLAKQEKVARNLALAFPGKSDAERLEISRDVWSGVGALLVEYAHMDRICADPARLETVTEGRIKAFEPDGPPAIFVAAHLGNWELCAAAVTRFAPVTAVYTPLQNPYLDQLLARRREALGCRLLPRDTSMRGLVRELSAGRSIGMIMDQRVDSGRPVPMFGIDKLTTLVPARLALRYGCELVPLRIERLGDARYRVTFHEPVTPADPDADAAAQALDMTQSVNLLFEQWIRARPGDWFCAKRRWPKDAVPAAVPDAAGEAGPPPVAGKASGI